MDDFKLLIFAHTIFEYDKILYLIIFVHNRFLNSCREGRSNLEKKSAAIDKDIRIKAREESEIVGYFVFSQ